MINKYHFLIYFILCWNYYGLGGLKYNHSYFIVFSNCSFYNYYKVHIIKLKYKWHWYIKLPAIGISDEFSQFLTEYKKCFCCVFHCEKFNRRWKPYATPIFSFLLTKYMYRCHSALNFEHKPHVDHIECSPQTRRPSANNHHQWHIDTLHHHIEYRSIQPWNAKHLLVRLESDPHILSKRPMCVWSSSDFAFQLQNRPKWCPNTHTLHSVSVWRHTTYQPSSA